ncbi:hypothetical protein SEA_BARNSTORMER_34 [Microbacterium phage Barnstormer]|uniref:Uncharacterized protein n=1 Tax=Microbacterium phage Barnstormer TaxID=3028491 RepID=A0AAE9ZN72_9CAUD|nr:hypothetical protein SEA_BARNSTORMER_34 [Microbacterium phage Barnstormer]WDS52140.1 hypothetical protein SEA_UTZCHIPS_34 [Microbacterium phage UtzChips]
MTDRNFTPASLDEVSEGDIVRMTKGDIVIVAPVANDRSYGLYLDIPFADVDEDDIEVDVLVRQGYRLERVVTPLPTALFALLAPSNPRGFYAGAVLTRAGWRWVYQGGNAPREDDVPDTTTLAERLDEGILTIAFEGVPA